jgi:hypothetical protein
VHVIGLALCICTEKARLENITHRIHEQVFELFANLIYRGIRFLYAVELDGETTNNSGQILLFNYSQTVTHKSISQRIQFTLFFF